ncbi:hypothetical protein ZWY2020_019307 [Hordeum vulgare]|nr:hypothetical protein ZWY2020_019307 [Hordeum vulgare]
MSVVGTCNGLICLCDDRIEPAGATILANPVTGETLALPPLPYAGGKQMSWYRPYSFTYNPARGQYNVVHAPYDLDPISVFTLGEASWRHVPGPDRETVEGGTIIVNGTMYWTVSERIAPVEPLPSVLSSRPIPSTWRRLMEVRGRLCIAISHVSQALNKEEMWVMEEGRHQGRWSRWYSLHKHRAAAVVAVAVAVGW